MNTSRGAFPRPKIRGKLASLLPCLFLGLLAFTPCAAQTCNYTVTSLADSGAGTLRAALADPAITDICFNQAGTITLASTLQIQYPVTITGSITIDGNNQVQIFNVNMSIATQTARSNGLVLTHGKAINGGALQVTQGAAILVGTTITGNTANSGAGVFNQGTLTLSGCGISSNTASAGSGGAIYNDANALLTLQGTTVSQNSASTGGGGLYNAGNTELSAGIFTGNTGGFYGGAIYNDFSATLPFSGGTSFINNTASQGGAIYNFGTTRITQSLFTGNTAQGNIEVGGEGGALYNAGSATVTETTIVSNSSSQNGGAIGNLAQGVLTLVNDTVYSNSAPGLGSGVDNQPASTITLHNTIVTGTAPSCAGCGNVSADNLVDVEPYLGPLASNGGATYSMMPLPGGPAVGGGDPATIVDDTDQRGFSRLAASGSVDVGAVQSHFNAVTYLAQPSNTFINQTIPPPPAVQVVELDGATKNYPLGVPVVVSLFTSQGVQASSSLTGTLTQLPVTTNGVTAATFADLAVNTAGSYELQATIVPATITSSAALDPAYGVMSNIFQINPAPLITWQPAPVVYGPLPANALNATATINGSPATGTFAYTFASTGAPIIAGQIYPAGSYPVQAAFTPAGTTLQYTLITSLQIHRATPTLTWPTPAPIYTITPLSSTQLNATATGITGVALAGTFAYTPLAGTLLLAGPQTLSVDFTPADATNYTTATARVTIQVGYSPISITSVSPNTSGFSKVPLTIALTGAGFTPTAVVHVNGTAIATTVQSTTALTAILPADDLASQSTLQLVVYDPQSLLSSNAFPFTVTAPPADVTFSVPPNTGSGEQTAVVIGLNTAYPADLQGTLAVTFTPKDSNGVDDPAIQLSTGGRTLTFTIPAGSTTTPQVALQTGTVAGTITLTLTLNAGGADVTPPSVGPIPLIIAPAAPVITSVKFSNDGQGQITVNIIGFSNTRDMTQAEFVFTGTDASHLRSAKVDVPAANLFSSWYVSPASDQYGSEFGYTQTFQLSTPDAGLTGVTVTLANSVGSSGSVNSQ